MLACVLIAVPVSSSVHAKPHQDSPDTPNGRIEAANRQAVKAASLSPLSDEGENLGDKGDER